MKKAALGDYLLFNGKPAQVIGIAEGKTIILKYLTAEDRNKCPHCGRESTEEWLEHSPIFQESAEPLKTMDAKNT